jgi:hypothetical protein
MVTPSPNGQAYALYVGTYVGSAILLDDRDVEIASANVSLATVNLIDGTWQGYVHGIDASALAGREVMVMLPSGLHARARVVVDIPGERSPVRLVGIDTGLI